MYTILQYILISSLLLLNSRFEMIVNLPPNIPVFSCFFNCCIISAFHLIIWHQLPSSSSWLLPFLPFFQILVTSHLRLSCPLSPSLPLCPSLPVQYICTIYRRLQFHTVTVTMCLYRWYSSSTATLHHERQQDAMRNIRYFYSHVVNGVCSDFVILIIIGP